MTGEQAADENVSDPRSFMAKPRWQRLIIAAAGPFMNIVLAVGVLTGLYMVKYQKVADSDLQAVIGHVIAGFTGGQSRTSGWRPHRQTGRQVRPQLGRRGRSRKWRAPTGPCT